MGLIYLMLACAADYGMRYSPIVVESVEEVFETTDGELWMQEYEAAGAKLDLLWVVDTSCSMSGELMALPSVASDIASSMGAYPFTDLEWRMGVIESSITGAHAARWTEDETQVEYLFSAIGHNYDENGLLAAQDSMAWDQSFHRQDSSLLIVFVSDEDEYGTTAADYEAVTGSYKQSPFYLLHSAVVHESDACRESGEDIGSEYIAVADHVVSICDQSLWNEALKPAEDVAGNIGKVFTLDFQPLYPEVDNILVMVDGQFTNAWNYLGSENAVELHQAPEPGAMIQIAFVH